MQQPPLMINLNCSFPFKWRRYQTDVLTEGWPIYLTSHFSVRIYGLYCVGSLSISSCYCFMIASRLDHSRIFIFRRYFIKLLHWLYQNVVQFLSIMVWISLEFFPNLGQKSWDCLGGYRPPCPPYPPLNTPMDTLHTFLHSACVSISTIINIFPWCVNSNECVITIYLYGHAGSVKPYLQKTWSCDLGSQKLFNFSRRKIEKIYTLLLGMCFLKKYSGKI